MTDNTQTEALLPSRETLMAQAQVFASAWAIAGSRFDSGDGMEVAEQEKAILADMTRRLHARIAELEAQLESIGAGGVSGPLMGQPQAMPDLSALTERGAKAWAGVDAQGLREGFTAADMATASAQGFRDGVASVAASAPAPSAHIKEPYTLAEIKAKIASNDYGAEMLLQHAMLLLDSASLAASAGSEPVAWLVCTEEGDPDMVFLSRHEAQQYLEDDERPTPLYTHPSPPEGTVGVWTALPGALPEPGVPVLLDIGKKYPIRALWAAKHTVEAADDDTDWAEYDEATETYYCPEGWYEWNEHEEIHWAVSETPRAWMPLPPTSAEGVEHG